MVTERELNAIKGLLHYLNENVAPPTEAGLSVEVKLIDSNGDSLGVIDWSSSTEAYCLYFPKGDS